MNCAIRPTAVLITFLAAGCAHSKLPTPSPVGNQWQETLSVREQCAALDQRGALGQDTLRNYCSELEVAAGKTATALQMQDMALYHFQRALLYAPENSVAHNAVGEIFLARHAPKRACEYFARALRSDPQNLVAKRNRTQCLIDQGMLAEATRVLNQCEGPDDLACYCARGREVWSHERVAPPEGLSRETLLSYCPQARTLDVDRCERLLNHGSCDQAADACHAALSAWPTNVAARQGWRSAQACVIDRLARHQEAPSNSEAATVKQDTPPHVDPPISSEMTASLSL